MQIKKFEARTIQEALDTVKRELGPEAIILKTKKNKKGFGLLSNVSIEITAAVSDKAITKKRHLDNRVPDETKETISNLPVDKQQKIYNKYVDRNTKRDRSRQSNSAQNTDIDSVSLVENDKSKRSRITATRYIDIHDIPQKTKPIAINDGDRGINNRAVSLEEEVKNLKQIINDIKMDQSNHLRSSSANVGSKKSYFDFDSCQRILDHLILSGVERRHAIDILHNAAFSAGDDKLEDPEIITEFVAQELYEKIEVFSLLENICKNINEEAADPNVIALVGPTGVGKTTTVAKIASESILNRNSKVGLINLDSYKVSATDQLETYAKILNIPFRSVSNVDDLKCAIQDFRALDLVLIDTTGRSQKDLDSLQSMYEVLSHVPNIRSELVLSTNTKDSELADIGKKFSLFKPEGLIFSKLDESMSYGSIYNISHKLKLPLVYFTTGQKVPEDIEVASKERLVSLILDL